MGTSGSLVRPEGTTLHYMELKLGCLSHPAVATLISNQIKRYFKQAPATSLASK